MSACKASLVRPAPDRHARVEHFSRQADGIWTLDVHTGLGASLAVASVGCTVKLTAVYDRVKFS